ncbi:hypothetical protein ACCY16_17525 [Candidatus Pantoea formicae]|uniref:hypothetical protein n=1 Tax=Candidatus Pantoea formicae TaxID=2608355 RepID=UPI003ED9F9CA
MQSLARKLGTRAIEANEFRYCEHVESGSPLVIDAFDELAVIDSSGIHALLAKVQQAKPACVVVSSRSSEWSESSTIKFGKRFNLKPLVVRLLEFSVEEQHALFSHRHPNEDFERFARNVQQFGLGMLLSNPQFLDMLASAYTEDMRHFTSREAIFAQSVMYQASERNIEIVTSPSTLSAEQTVKISSDIFTKLLLSGAEGVAMTQPAIKRIYPYLYSLVAPSLSPKGILASRLFKPGSMADQHRPVHKIIAEYCASIYLCARIADKADPLTLRKCMSVIAPGGYVRDELRGLLGWMASASSAIQHDIIRADPYAVLANGDPSRLELSSRLLLIKQLEQLEESNPFFRRSDAWRRFSVTGFFTPEVIDAIRPILLRPGEGHLRDLLLELLADAPQAASATDILSNLLLDHTLNRHTRWLAAHCLIGLDNFDHSQNLASLTDEATPESLRLASEIMTGTHIASYSVNYLAKFLKICARLYPGHRENLTASSSDHYFIEPSIKTFPAEGVPHLLDLLTDRLACTCGRQRYECDCRTGISKITGHLMDHFFHCMPPPYEPGRIWEWVRNLNFHGGITADRSEAVRVLQSDHTLRRAIYRHALAGATEENALRNLVNDFFRFSYYSHSGLCFTANDQEFLLEMAYGENNTLLWSSLFPYHVRNNRPQDKKPNPLRHMCRQHAKASPRFMRAWSLIEHSLAKLAPQPDPKLVLKIRRSARQRQALHIANLEYLKKNRDEILTGQRWDLLDRFAHTLLSSPEKIIEIYGDEGLVKDSIINSLSCIAVHVPDLAELAEFNIRNETYFTERVLLAACLLVLERDNSLDGVDLKLLRTLRVRSQSGYNGKMQALSEKLTAEIDRIIFPQNQGTEAFLREYLEPQLARGAQYPSLELITRPSIFTSVRGQMALEWLERLSSLTPRATKLLFDIACQENELVALTEIVSRRCAVIQSEWPEKTDNDDREEIRLFWLIRAFYLLSDCPAEYWEWIIACKANLSRLEALSGRWQRTEKDNWVSLTPAMIGAILEGFTEQWFYPDSFVGPVKEDSADTDAKRFLHDIVYSFSATEPAVAIPVVRKLINDSRMLPFFADLKSVLATLERDKMLRNYSPPSPIDIAAMLDKDEVVTVEGLRETVLFQLEEYQRHVRNSEYNALTRFYPGGVHIGEEPSTEIITEWLSISLLPCGISVVKEHEVNNEKRADFSATRMYEGRRLLLMAEVKGQWNKELYTAAYEQLYNRYSITPDAGLQGIYIALWFGRHEKVADRVRHNIENAHQLKQAIRDKMPVDLLKQIDVFVLDLSPANG